MRQTTLTRSRRMKRMVSFGEVAPELATGAKGRGDLSCYWASGEGTFRSSASNSAGIPRQPHP